MEYQVWYRIEISKERTKIDVDPDRSFAPHGSRPGGPSLLPGKVRAIAEGWNRIQNTFSFIVLDRKPHFYALVLEKNGKDYRLTSSDIFEVSYRDEFVIKEVSTDVLFGGAIAVDVAGLGDKNDFGKLLKGIDLVDKAVLTGRGGVGENRPGDYSLRITYRGDPIAPFRSGYTSPPGPAAPCPELRGIRRSRSNTSNGRSP